MSFKTPAIRRYAWEIAQDEKDHVRFLRGALGSAAVARPKIDIKNSFTAAARAAVRKISAARDSLDGSSDIDQGIGSDRHANIVPTDSNGIAFSRTPGQVLNVVYLTPARAGRGGFFPQGVNGPINTSAANGG